MGSQCSIGHTQVTRHYTFNLFIAMIGVNISRTLFEIIFLAAVFLTFMNNRNYGVVAQSKICTSYQCFLGLTSANQLDARCRKIAHLGLNLCYCCGGYKKYVEYGKICRRFCLYEKVEDGSSAKICKLNEGIPEMDNSIDLDAPYPVIPKKLPLNNLTCSCQDPGLCQVYEPCGFFCVRKNDDIIENIECTNSLEQGACENGAQKFHITIVLCVLTAFIMFCV